MSHLTKLDEEIKTLTDANVMLKQYSDCYDALNETMDWIIKGRLVATSIGPNDLLEFGVLMNKMKAALVRAQGGHRVGHAKVD